MAFPYEFHPLAEKELFEAIESLDDQRQGYGALLAESAANTLDQIIDNPERFPVASIATLRRRALLPKPFHKTFTIYFDFDGESILIACFFNNRRDPKTWQERD